MVDGVILSPTDKILFVLEITFLIKILMFFETWEVS